MRRLGKMLFGAITVAVIGGTGLCANSSICRAAGENLTVGEVYNTALEASYGDTFRGVYENYLAGSPLEAEKADGVDTATGHLMLSRNDLSLEGTGGMDFELNLLIEKSPKAYLAKNKGKEYLHTVTYAYYNTNTGYPAEDKPFCLCTLIRQE